MLDEARKNQNPTRVALYSTAVMDEVLGATVRDPDGNILIDMVGGIAVSAVGRNHPKVVDAIRRQSAKIMHTAGRVNANSLELAKKWLVLCLRACVVIALLGLA